MSQCISNNTPTDAFRYNSTVFTTTRQTAYVVGVVTSDFEQGVPFDLQFTNTFTGNGPVPYPETLKSGTHTNYYSQTPNFFYAILGDSGYKLSQIRDKDEDVLSRLQTKALSRELMNVTGEECRKMYLESPAIDYGHVLAVSSNTTSDNSILWLDSSTLPNKSSSAWLHAYGDAIITQYDPSDTWVVGLYVKHERRVWEYGGYPISRCLVERAEDPCLLRYNSGLLLVVLIANIVKLVAMAATIFQYRQPALVTIGDALASFLEMPDRTTRHMCFAGKSGFSSNIWTSGPKTYLMNKAEFHRSSSASQLQWGITTAM